jgi:hypothetical protein
MPPSACESIYNFYFSIDNCQALFIGASHATQSLEVHADFKKLVSIPDVLYIAVVKTVDNIEPERRLQSQIQVITLNSDSFTAENTSG